MWTATPLIMTAKQQTWPPRSRSLEDKEVNLWRAFTEHGMRPQIYEKLSREYDDERRRIESTIQAIQLDKKDYVANLDAALAIIAEIADRYVLHTPERQRDILKQMVSRVVINPEGRIIRIELKPPFNYLDGLHQSGGSGPDGKRPRPQNKKTSALDTGSLQNSCGAPIEISNSSLSLERATSWSPRRWGRDRLHFSSTPGLRQGLSCVKQV